MSNCAHGELLLRYKTTGYSEAVDIKFLLRNSGEATSEIVGEEWRALNEAVAEGKCSAIDLGALRWKD